jgi:hypothetical protein
LPSLKDSGGGGSKTGGKKKYDLSSSYQYSKNLNSPNLLVQNMKLLPE